MEPGQAARKMRLRAKLTGKEAAKKLRTAPTLLYRMERGGPPGLSESWVRRMAEAYGCAPSDIDPKVLDLDEFQLLDLYRNLHPLIRPQAHDLLRKLRKERVPAAENWPDTESLLADLGRLLYLLQQRLRDPATRDKQGE